MMNEKELMPGYLIMKFQYIANNIPNLPERGKRKGYIYKVNNHCITDLTGNNGAISQNSE